MSFAGSGRRPRLFVLAPVAGRPHAGGSCPPCHWSPSVFPAIPNHVMQNVDKVKRQSGFCNTPLDLCGLSAYGAP